LDDQGPIGVCCDVSVDIGGVEVKQHIFVVEHSNHDLILGQLWERVGNVLRGQYSSMKRLALLLFGSKVGTMRQFCAVGADRERNGAFAKPGEGGMFGSHYLKA